MRFDSSTLLKYAKRRIFEMSSIDERFSEEVRGLQMSHRKELFRWSSRHGSVVNESD